MEQLRRFRAEQDLARLGCGLHLDRPAGSGACYEKLTMRLPHEEELEAARVEARVHLQLNGADRRTRPADRTEGAAHLERRPCCPGRMVLVVVEKQQRVPAELEQPAALGIRDVE